MALLNRIKDIHKTKGLKGIVKVTSDRLLSFVFGTILFHPLHLLLVALRPIKLIRFSSMHAHRIGSLAGNMGYYTCERKHGVAHVGTFDIFYYDEVSNYQLLKMWGRVLHISYLARFFAQALSAKKPNSPHFFKTTSTDKYNLRTQTESFIDLTAKEENEAIEEMAKKFNPEKKPFISLLSRDSRFLQSFDPTKDWSYHNYRNSHISTYREAAEAIAKRGSLFIRMGSLVSEPLGSNLPGVIDYAYKNYRSELLDIYLTARCKFFITTGTGLDTLANIFHRPVLYINFLPHFNFCFFPNVISVPKVLFSKKENRLLTFKEILQSEICYFYVSEMYEKAGIQIIDNTPDEILDAVLEMDMRLDGTWVPDPVDEELQKKFWDIFPKNTGYHAGEVQSRVGASFLRKYRHLL